MRERQPPARSYASTTAAWRRPARTAVAVGARLVVIAARLLPPVGTTAPGLRAARCRRRGPPPRRGERSEEWGKDRTEERGVVEKKREGRGEERKWGNFKVGRREKREWVFLRAALLIGPHKKIGSFKRTARENEPIFPDATNYHPYAM